MAESSDIITLTDSSTPKGDHEAVDVREMSIRRCNGCAGCVTKTPGTCVLEDDATGMLSRAMGHRTITIESSLDKGWFSMPMRKVVERLSNILQAFTDDGGNIPLDTDSVGLRRIIIRVPRPENGDSFEGNVREALLMGPVESIEFEYL